MELGPPPAEEDQVGGPCPRRDGPSPPAAGSPWRSWSANRVLLAVDRDRPPHRPRLRLQLGGGGVLVCRDAPTAASSASPSTRCNRRRTVVACGTGCRPVSGIGREAEDILRILRGIRDPLADRDERAGPGQHRRGGRAQQRDRRIPQSPHIAGIGDQGQETPQVSDIV